MTTLEQMYSALGVSQQVCDLGQSVLDGLETRFREIDRRAEINQGKVLYAMQKNKVSAACFAATTGYGSAARRRAAVRQWPAL